jgi:hypothetical protein
VVSVISVVSKSVQGQIVDDQQLDAMQFAHLVFVGAVQARPARALR